MSLTERIIEIVQKYPILYDLSHPFYKNIRKKDKICDEIGFELQEKGEDIKKKWRNLRGTYAKYLRSLKTKTGQAAKKNYSNWQWSKQMEFFRPFISFAKTSSNIRGIGEEEIATESQVTEVQGTVTSDAEDGELEETYSPSAATNHQSDTQSVASTPSHTQSNTSLTRKLRTSGHHYQQKLQKEKKENSSSVDAMVNYFENERARYDKTPIDLIFSGFVQTVKSFSPKRQVITKMKIAQIIADQELEHIEEMESLSRPLSSASDFTSPSLTPLPASSPEQPDYTPISSQSKYRFSLQPYIKASKQQNLSSCIQTFTQLDVQPDPQLSEQPRTFFDQNFTQTRETYTPFEQTNSSVASCILQFNPSQ